MFELHVCASFITVTNIIVKATVYLSQILETSADFWLSCLCPVVYLLTKTLKIKLCF